MRLGAVFLLWVAVCCAFAPQSRCVGCHPKIAASYMRTGMARSFAVAAENIPGLGVEDRVRFLHQTSNRWYTLYRRDGAAYLRRHQTGVDGKENNVVEARVDYVLGSGNHARGLIHRAPDGRLMQLPVAWYAEDAAWGMAPGYDRPDHADFRRAVDGGCMFCHNAYPADGVREALGAEPAFPAELPQGIDCERCHGPGGEHVRTANPAAILNPARLSLERQMEICMQCHLQPSSRMASSTLRRVGRGVFSHDPREPLSSYMLFFDQSPPVESFEVNHTAYRLRESRCFRESGGRMVCTTCHNPHEATRTEAVQRACRSCHSSLGRGHVVGGNCASCHMAKRRAEDAVHVIMTDHRISRRPAADLLRRLAEARDSYRGGMALYYPAQPSDGYALDFTVASASIAALERALKRLRVAPAEASFALAEAYRKAGNAGRILSIMREANLPLSAPQLNYLGTVYEAAGELDRSAGVLRQAIAVAPELPEPHLNLGVTLTRQGQADAAAAAFQEAIRLAPDLAAAHNNLAYLMAARGEARLAEFHFTEAIRLDPNYWAAHLGYARLLRAAGRREEAAEHLRQAARSPEESLRREALAALGSR